MDAQDRARRREWVVATRMKDFTDPALPFGDFDSDGTFLDRALRATFERKPALASSTVSVAYGLFAVVADHVRASSSPARTCDPATSEGIANADANVAQSRVCRSLRIAGS
jgi:hypothetical protein